ncbi:MAG TPA: MerR family transcriptional regulator [Actinocrinis sp.]|nr:MerR family transcriptional regulator [Actinocrinis sp.]
MTSTTMRTTYSISEVSQISGLSAHTLRWYEQIGLIPAVGRGPSGQRCYGEGDLTWLKFLGHLRSTGMPVADMLRYAELSGQGDHTRPARRAMLEALREQVRAQVAELNATLAVLDHKITTVYAEREH